MKNGRLGRLLLVTVCLICLVSQARSESKPAASYKADAAIVIDASKPLPYKIPPTIFGTFLEPIGNSIYGGLWADELANPSFEDDLWTATRVAEMIKQEPPLSRASELGLPLPWEPLDSNQGARYEPRWGDAANSFRSLLIMALPGKETGVRQKVYLPVRRELIYHASVFAKYVGGPRSLGISIRKAEPTRCWVSVARRHTDGRYLAEVFRDTGYS